MVESSFDVQPAAIATNTTNLININISNTGNITAVATGENHQINKCYTAINPSAQLRLQPNSQSRSSQYASLPISSNHCATEAQQRSPLTANINQIEVFGSDLNTISTIATTSTETNTDALSCNYKNCTISSTLNRPKHRNDVVFQTPQHNRVKKNGDANLALMRNQSNNTILPPPLFDESSSSISTATLPLLPNDSIRQMKSRRHHRTIPRHFTLNDGTNSSNGTNTLSSKTKAHDESANKNCSGSAIVNKKSVCQCPVQHVPMTYMGSAYLNLTRNQPTNEMLLSTLTKKWPNQKANVAKSASFTSTPSSGTSSLNNSTTALGYNRNSASGLLSANNPLKPSVTLATAETQTNGTPQSKATSKIATISKQIGHNESNPIAHSQIQQQSNNETVDAKPMQELLPISINNGKVNSSTRLSGQKMAPNSEGDSMSLVPKTNPILPPKLSKAQTFIRPAECMPTVSKLSTSTNCSPSLSSNGATMATHHRPNLISRERSKSPATDKTYSMVTPLNLGTDHKMNHIKTTYPTTANLTIASNNFTLPKPSNATKTFLNVKNPSNSPHASSNLIANTTLSSSKSHSSSSTKAKKLSTSLHNDQSQRRQEIQSNDNQNLTNQIDVQRLRKVEHDKPLPVCTTFTNCSNPKEHFLPNDTSLDDDYLSECENCKSAHGSRYYLDEEHVDQPQETMTLQRKMDEKECDEQPYYRQSTTLPTNTKQKTT